MWIRASKEKPPEEQPELKQELAAADNYSEPIVREVRSISSILKGQSHEMNMCYCKVKKFNQYIL